MSSSAGPNTSVQTPGYRIVGPYNPSPNSNEQKRWDQLPVDIVVNILGRLDPFSLATAISCYPRWHTITNTADCPMAFQEIKEKSWRSFDPKTISSAIQIIDKSVWTSVYSPEILTREGLSFADPAPTNKKALCVFLKRLDFSKIEGEGANTGVTILTLPKGLTIYKLGRIHTNIPGRDINFFRYIFDRVLTNFGSKEIEKTKTVVISNNILINSRKKVYSEQLQMAIEMDAKVPDFLSVCTLSVLTYLSSPTNPPTRLFAHPGYTIRPGFPVPATNTVCEETLEDDSGVVRTLAVTVGKFVSEWPDEGLIIGACSCSDEEGDRETGIAFMKEIKTITQEHCPSEPDLS